MTGPEAVFDIGYRILLYFFGIDEIYVRFPESLRFAWIIPVLFAVTAIHIVWKRSIVRGLGMRLATIRAFFALLGVLVGIAFLIVTLSEPYGISDVKRPIYKGEAVDFGFDISESSGARDVSPERLEAAKRDVKKAVPKLQAAGISYFCLNYFTVAPNRLLECTTDTAGFLLTLQTLDRAFAARNSTNLLAAFKEHVSVLKNYIPEGTRITKVIITDGGKEAWRQKDGSIVVVEDAWSLDDLQKEVTRMTQEEKIRVIPVGLGGEKWVMVPTGGSDNGVVETEDGSPVLTKLDAETIKKIALWAGDARRYFILDGRADFGEWLASLMSREMIVERYIVEKSAPYELWRWPLGAGIFFLMISFGALGIFERITAKFLK